MKLRRLIVNLLDISPFEMPMLPTRPYCALMAVKDPHRLCQALCRCRPNFP